MRYFFLAILFIVAVVFGHRVVSTFSENMARESGQEQTTPVEQTPKQAEEDDSVHNTQRMGDDHVPRKQNEMNKEENIYAPPEVYERTEENFKEVE